MNDSSCREPGNFVLTTALLAIVFLSGCSAQTGTTSQPASTTTNSGTTSSTPSVEVPPGFKKVSMLDHYFWLVPDDYHAEVNETKGVLDVEAPASANAPMLSIETDFGGTQQPTPVAPPQGTQVVSGPTTVTSASGMAFDKVEYTVMDLHYFRMTSKTEHMLATVQGPQPLPPNVKDVYEKIVLSIKEAK
jgi:hypothetical protein